MKTGDAKPPDYRAIYGATSAGLLNLRAGGTFLLFPEVDYAIGKSECFKITFTGSQYVAAVMQLSQRADMARVAMSFDYL